MKKIKKAVKQGANAIECDLWYDEGKWSVSHDGVDKTDLNVWLQNLSGLHKKTGKPLLLIFDIKKSVSIIWLIDQVRNILSGSGIFIIYSMAKIKDATPMKQAGNHLYQNEFLSIDGENDPEAVRNFFESFSFPRGCYGNGIDSKFPNLEFHHSTMKKAVQLKNADAFAFVYAWTASRKQTIRKFLIEDNADGVMVNLNGLLNKPVKKAQKILRSLNARE